MLSNRFESIIREMTNTVMKASRSAVIKNARDMSCGLLTFDHRLVSVEEGIPIHITALDLTTKPNAITNYLGVHNPVASGAPYRGIVASFLGTHGRDPVGLADLYVYVWLELQAFNNNDFTSYGLWPLGIPTLNQFNTMMTPQFYLMLTELLARPSDRQARSFAVITVPNQRILKLWGVRFVIADYTLPFGAVGELAHEELGTLLAQLQFR